MPYLYFSKLSISAMSHLMNLKGPPNIGKQVKAKLKAFCSRGTVDFRFSEGFGHFSKSRFFTKSFAFNFLKV